MSEAENRLRRLKFRAWHRGTREADYMIGCFFDRYGASWGEAEIAWFEALLDEEDVVTMPGESFGARGAGHLRVALTVNETTMAEAAKRITRLAARL